MYVGTRIRIRISLECDEPVPGLYCTVLAGLCGGAAWARPRARAHRIDSAEFVTQRAAPYEMPANLFRFMYTGGTWLISGGGEGGPRTNPDLAFVVMDVIL